MKNFLMCSIIGMLAAGIYGTVDLTFDVKNGTLIQYEDGEELPSVTQFSSTSKGIFKKTNLHVARTEKKVTAPPALVNSFSDLSLGDFSRGEPPMYYEAMLIASVGQPDSLQNTEVSAAITDTIAALHGKAESDSATTKKEERKFSLSLYSRKRPRPVAREEVAVENDSLNSAK